ncbi:oxygenase MpaB family protein [Jongsikchunia kroppenstedtii]|uniref:oxygenase MpaB family protein n=1 Tax=Jongsikchunia kroppenstedtii TaxID=1121721 RepID=UPI0003791010|nr:oxygenase MpaB family protein [Jongsikchunia kroppenstedtii]
MDLMVAPTHRRLAGRVKKLTRFDLLPPQPIQDAYLRGHTAGDPVAERFVADTYHGEMGGKAATELLDRALREGISAIDDAPESMRALFAEFETIPDWVDPELIEAGAAVWRRWGYSLGAVGNAGTMDTYTEASLAVPLSLSGGYAGASALHRYLETTRWWLEVCQPGAVLTPGSTARTVSLKVRVMHVSVRARVADHSEWDSARWGLPISQTEMMLTLLGGSVGPAFGLFGLGFLTSPAEMRAVLHFNRYLGHLVGCRVDDMYPETVADGLRLLYYFDATRQHDSGELGHELVEGFVPSWEPPADMRGIARLRAKYHLQLQAGYTRLFMLPWNRRQYRLPSGLPGLAILVGRAPLIAAIEILRRLSPAIDRRWQTGSMRRWQRWHAWQIGRKVEAFDATQELRR